ncbi:two-component system, NtrC family, nitrogen regulation response regulator GlnG [Albimonas donghaensis]|uniref:DNA-binding transcriptional regulator NtrC n=1 Tax=Albimonas donghaensis TaxID=356660 RepID=A0A1H2ST08_9RHOB|nr:nitrogen regulation protein NR(I) [Albimonas donghaensis]MBR29060.1 nitrogen regulation protein NR(I) [Paracoccaceae bacterium]SDW34595.1 two-component system, NtrC family, nitrogen regulation response regulator GlnG [Albimonas donghaensis]
MSGGRLNGTVLVADDDRAIRTVLSQALTRAGCRVRSTGSASTLWRWVEDGEGDAIVTDVMMPDGDALDLLPAIRKKRPELPVIVMSAQNNMLTAIRAAEVGAYEYLPKPFDLRQVIEHVERALEGARTPEAASPDTGRDEGLPIIGRSAAMQEVYRIMARLMNTDLTVMINGESGTGKELVARALHSFGWRKQGPFVAVNMAAIPRDLIEAELFGHERGAFTGATERMAGKFEAAASGTLFLDEIGDMPLDAQTRLLRVLQDGQFTRIGGRTPIKADVRVIAATHQDLRGLINEGSFREDLFYRLNVVPVRLPPLRDRVEDVPDLARAFLRKAESEGLPRKAVSSEALEALKSQAWPGNVRELENLMKRLAALCADDVISLADVEKELAARPSAVAPDVERGASLGASVEAHLRAYFQLHGDALPPPGLYDRILREVELPLIALTLSATRGNQLRAADLLGINRNTLRKKIRELDIPVTRGKTLM